MQRINLNRIIDELAINKLLTPDVVEGLKGIDDTPEKSAILTQILHGRGAEGFKLFLKAVMDEPQGSKYYKATREFFAGFVNFRGYEEYAAWLMSESLCSSFFNWLISYISQFFFRNVSTGMTTSAN